MPPPLSNGGWRTMGVVSMGWWGKGRKKNKKIWGREHKKSKKIFGLMYVSIVKILLRYYLYSHVVQIWAFNFLFRCDRYCFFSNFSSHVIFQSEWHLWVRWKTSHRVCVLFNFFFGMTKTNKFGSWKIRRTCINGNLLRLDLDHCAQNMGQGQFPWVGFGWGLYIFLC